ncbi:MAG: tetratricopeptide repeat protein [Nitrospirota bacterium]
MPKQIKKKISKTLNAEAEVKNKLYSLKDTFQERKKTILKYSTGIIVVIMAIASFLFYSYTSQKKAKMLEYEAYNIYYNEYQKLPLDNKELQYKNALEIFKKAYEIKKSPSSLFYIASCYYELGKYDDALNALNVFIKKYSDEDNFLPLVYQKMAMVYVKKGNITEAMKTLDILYNKSDIYKDLAIMEYGSLLEKEGKSEEAKKKYKELITKFPASPFTDDAQTKLSKEKEG